MTKKDHIITKGLSKIIEAIEVLACQENNLVQDLTKDIEEGVRIITEGLDTNK